MEHYFKRENLFGFINRMISLCLFQETGAFLDGFRHALSDIGALSAQDLHVIFGALEFTVNHCRCRPLPILCASAAWLLQFWRVTGLL